MIRAEAGCGVSRFAALVGVPRRSYHARLARHCAGEATKGPWPAPVVDRIEAAVAKLAGEFPAWGHRKIWAMGAYEGWDLASPSSVHRAMARRDLLQPVRYQAQRRQLAAARREAFVTPPVATTTYSCPSGYTLNGTTCSRTLSASVITTTTYSCASGYTLITNLIGNTLVRHCSRTVTQDATATTTYSCSSDYTLNGTTCTKTTTKPLITTYTCPTGYDLSDTTLNRPGFGGGS